MSTFEDRLQVALRDLADDVGTEPALRWVAPATRTRPGARAALSVAAVAVALLMATVAAVVLRQDRSGSLEPVQQPPRVVRLSELQTARPGHVVLAVTLATSKHEAGTPTYLLQDGASTAVALTPSTAVPSTWSQSLSPDGTQFVRQSDQAHEPGIELLDLRTGRTDDLGGATGACPSVSPDSATLALLTSQELRLLDLRTRSSSAPLRGLDPDSGENCSGGLGWSPDGGRLAVRQGTGTVVIERSGRVVRRAVGTLTNGSMSWSPDGDRLLVYQRDAGRFVVLDVGSGASSVLRTPRSAVEPLGWAGSRIVWIAGAAGHQRLVTTDAEGADAHLWLRFDVGPVPIESVQWSQELSGAARR